MKKILLIGTAAIVLALVVTPKFVSNSFNQKLGLVVESINKNPAYSASITSQTNGWFSSQVTINIGFDSGALAQENAPEIQEMFANMNFDVELDAQHGPLLTQNGLTLGWLAWNAKVEADSFREKLEFDANLPFYQINSQTNLLGVSSFTDSIPSFEMKNDPVFNQLSFSGWNGTGSFSNSEASYQGLLGSINIDSALGAFALQQWNIDSTIQSSLLDAMDGNFYDSTMALQIQNITFEAATTESTTTMTELKMDGISKFDETTSLLDTQINVSLKELATPQVNVSSIIVNSEVNNLKEQFFKAYQTLMTQISKEPETMQDGLNELMQAELLGQLQAEPEFNINLFEANINQGNIKGSLTSKIHQVTQLPETIESPQFWVQHILANSKMNADKSAALWLAVETVKSQIKADPSAAQMSEEDIAAIAEQQAPAMLTGMSQQGLFTETEAGYQIEFSLKEGQALLNGNPMPLPFGQ
jgi:uncharacterized protein YdgA (DUF945 family)